jgi:hypothetical protein
VSWSGPTHRSRGWVTVLAAVACLLGAPRQGRAGCHVPGQLSSHPRLAWEESLIPGSSARHAARAPLVLTNPHCPSDAPRVVDSLSVMTGIAMRVGATFTTAALSQKLALPELRGHRQPLLSRLDRPPRPVSCA